MKKTLGFFKYWWIMYRCVGISGVIFMGMWPNSSTKDYEKIWDMKD